MATIESELTEDTLNSALRSAAAGHMTLDQWLNVAIQRAALATPAEDALLGTICRCTGIDGLGGR